MNETHDGAFGDWGLLEPLGGPDAVVGDDAVLAAMVDVERALLLAWSREAGAPDGLARGRGRAVASTGIDRAALLAETRRSGVAAISLVEQLRQRAEARAASAAAPGCTAARPARTSSTRRSCWWRTAASSWRATRLVAAGEHLAALAEAEADTVAMGRTLSQHATPLTLGSRVAGWLDGVTSAIDAIDATDFPVQLGGPVGIGDSFERLAENRGPRRGCAPSSPPSSDSPTPGARGRSSARRCCRSRPPPQRCRSRSAGSVATSPCSPRTEVGELIPGSGGGSSSMPHKHNPVAAVLLTANGLRAPGLLATVQLCALGAGERPAGEWHASWQPLRELVRLAVNGAEAAAAEFGDLYVDREAIEFDLGTAHADEAVLRTAQAGGRELPSNDSARSPEEAADERSPPARLGHPGRRLRIRHRAARAAAVARHDDRALGRRRRRMARLAPAVRILRVDLPGHGASPATTEPFTMAELAAATLAPRRRGRRRSLPRRRASRSAARSRSNSRRRATASSTSTMVCSGARIGTPDGLGGARRAGARVGHRIARLRQRGPLVRARLPRREPRRSRRAALLQDARRRRRRELRALLRGARRVRPHGRPSPSSTMPDAAARRGARRRHHAGRDARARRRVPRRSLRRARRRRRTSPSPRTRPPRPARSRRHVEPRDARGPAGCACAVPCWATPTSTARSRATTPETAAFQDFITRYAWGEIWARPELSRRDRSIATLASLVTGGHEHELRMHVRAALRNGLSRDEIAEVILHTALYAGLPPANGALAIAREVFAEVDAEVDAEGEADG